MNTFEEDLAVHLMVIPLRSLDAIRSVVEAVHAARHDI